MENYLQHHGILGQRWGVRRFQNEDGSYTEAGKDRRNRISNKYKRSDGSLNDAGRARFNKDGSKKKLKSMSDSDLKRTNERLSQEERYKQLNGKSQLSKALSQDTLIKAGASFVGGAALAGLGQYYMLVSNPGSYVFNGKKFVRNMLLAGTAATVVSVTNSFGGNSSNALPKNKK